MWDAERNALIPTNMTDSARRQLIEWCRQRQRVAQDHIANGRDVRMASLGLSDALHEELIIEGERDDQEREDIQE